MRPHQNLLSHEAGPTSEEDVLDFLGNDSVVGGEARTGQLTGARALMLAVFEDGIRSYLGGGRLAAAEAEAWLRSERRTTPFAFVVLCETFGLDPDAVRQTVRRMKAANVPPHRALPRARGNVRVPGRVCLSRRAWLRRANAARSRRAKGRVRKVRRLGD